MKRALAYLTSARSDALEPQRVAGAPVAAFNITTSAS